MARYIEYGNYTVGYEIESDVDGNTAIIKSVTTEAGTVSDGFFDKDTIEDMKFHCREDFENRQIQHYLNTGETL